MMRRTRWNCTTAQAPSYACPGASGRYYSSLFSLLAGQQAVSPWLCSSLVSVISSPRVVGHTARACDRHTCWLARIASSYCTASCLNRSLTRKVNAMFYLCYIGGKYCGILNTAIKLCNEEMNLSKDDRRYGVVKKQSVSAGAKSKTILWCM
jgi:hypothetical protein